MSKVFQFVVLLATIAATFAAPPHPVDDIVRQTQIEVLFKDGVLADNSDAYLDTVIANTMKLRLST